MPPRSHHTSSHPHPRRIGPCGIGPLGVSFTLVGGRPPVRHPCWTNVLPCHLANKILSSLSRRTSHHHHQYCCYNNTNDSHPPKNKRNRPFYYPNLPSVVTRHGIIPPTMSWSIENGCRMDCLLFIGVSSWTNGPVKSPCGPPRARVFGD